MLKDFEKPKAEDKDEIKAETKQLKQLLVSQPQQLKEQKIPVIVLVEGWGAAGKGSVINQLISEYDPRFYNVCSMTPVPESECRYPFLYPFATQLPENGKITFMNSGCMEDCVRKYLRHEITREEYKRRIRQVNEAERQLRDGGYVIIKMFVHISRGEQFKRLKRLSESRDTAWQIDPDDLWQHREYDRFLREYDYFMEETNDLIPWHVLDGTDRKQVARDAMKLMEKKISKALEKGKYNGDPFEEDFPLVKMPLLKDVDLSVTITDEEYKKKLKKLQKRLGELHNVIYRKQIPVIICYEGWDAAGKGGNITEPLDARGYDVRPIPAPEPHELARHYLWRFWTRMPRTGHISIFDRTWYGRVMVERLEGFCTEKDWKRAYNEINEFERQLNEWGAVVLKFWIHIDSDTQLARFTDRQNTPEKQWKITDEDWRNRDKWPQYEVAVNEMLQKTSTKNAPWHIIESNDKKYARIRTLEIVVDTLEKACEKQFEKSLDE